MAKLEDAKQYISTLFEKQLDPIYTYHDYDHSIMVLESVNKIASISGISGQDLLILQIAALFHDSGFIYGANNHEKRGQEIADEYLSKNGFSREFISKVSICIAATKVGTKTDNPLAMVLQDADMSGLGSSNYRKITEKLRKELNNTTDKKIGKKFLANLENTLIITAKTSNIDILKEEGLADMDAFIALTPKCKVR